MIDKYSIHSLFLCMWNSCLYPKHHSYWWKEFPLQVFSFELGFKELWDAQDKPRTESHKPDSVIGSSSEFKLFQRSYSAFLCLCLLLESSLLPFMFRG